MENPILIVVTEYKGLYISKPNMAVIKSYVQIVIDISTVRLFSFLPYHKNVRPFTEIFNQIDIFNNVKGNITCYRCILC